MGVKLLLGALFILILLISYVKISYDSNINHVTLQSNTTVSNYPTSTSSTETLTSNISSAKENPNFTCPFKVRIIKKYRTPVPAVVFGVYENNTLKERYRLTGMDGYSKCYPEGIFLYTDFPDYEEGGRGGPARVLMLTPALKLRGNWTFNMAVKIYRYAEGFLIAERGAEYYNKTPCLHFLNASTWNITKTICLPHLNGGFDVTALKTSGSMVYLTTSRGVIFLLNGSCLKYKRIIEVSHSTPKDHWDVDANEKHVAVVYYAVSNKKVVTGFCILSSDLDNITCRKLNKIPVAVKLKDNTIYIKLLMGEIITENIGGNEP